jgi:hypothetical protein
MSKLGLAVADAPYGTITYTTAGAKTGKFNRFYVSAGTIISEIKDKDGNVVTTDYIQTPATALTAGGIHSVRTDHGYFSSITKDAAGEIIAVHANAEY